MEFTADGLAAILTIVSLILGIASVTLAISAFIFGWATFRSTSKVQIEMHDLVSKVSNKVEVLAELSSRQIEKTLDYFTSPVSRDAAQLLEEFERRAEEQNEKLKEEARREALDVLKDAKVDKESVDKLLSGFENLVGKSSERAKAQAAQVRLVRQFSIIEAEIMELMDFIGLEYSPDTPWEQTARELAPILAPGAQADLEEIGGVRGRLLHEDRDVPLPTLEHALSLAERLIPYLAQKKQAFG